ncbi:Photosystem I assembly protein Ycf4 [Bienertia sinuspersici]
MDRTYNGIWKNKKFLLGLYSFVSYLGRNLISLFPPPQQIIFFPQGIVMSFYGIAGSGYDRFDTKEGIVYIFRWGFSRKNCHIFFRYLIKDIQSIKLELKEGIILVVSFIWKSEAREPSP